jgi:hypothetical protein
MRRREYAHRWLRHIVSLPPHGGTFALVNISVKKGAAAPQKFTARWFIKWGETTFPGAQEDGREKYGLLAVELPGH